MDHHNHIAGNFDDLFSGKPDELSSSSPRVNAEDGYLNSEDAAWEMRDQAVAENRRLPETLNGPRPQYSNRPDIYQTMEEISVRNQPGPDILTTSDDIYGDTEDPVLWEDSDNTFDTYDDDDDDDDFAMIDPKNIINSSPTEPELIVKGFEFHNRLSETVKNQFFPEDYLRLACRDVDPTLPRKVQWRAWKAARDRYRFLQTHPDMQRPGVEEDADDIFQSSTLDHENSGTAPSLRNNDKTDDILQTQSVTSEIPGLELTRASIVRSKPHLSDLKPAETRSHHPSLIPRSPQRALSRTSSLSSSAMLDSAEEVSDAQPSTQTRSLLQGEVSSTNVESHKDMPSPAKTELLEYTQSNTYIPSHYQRPSEQVEFNAHGLCTPSWKSVDVAGMESTRAVRGSPVRFQPDEISRPDTPRPSFSNTSLYESIEREAPMNTWTDYRSPTAAPRSTSPSPSSIQSVQYLEDLDISMPLKEDTDIRDSVVSPQSSLQLQATSQIPGLNLSSTDQNSASPNLSRSLDSIDDLHMSSGIHDESSNAERRVAWLKFDEILQKVKEQVSAKSKSAPSPLMQTESSGFSELPQTKSESLIELSQVETQIDGSKILPAEITSSMMQPVPTTTNLNEYIKAQSPEPEQPKPLPHVMEPWQEPSKLVERSAGPTLPTSEPVSSTARMPQPQSEHNSQAVSDNGTGPFAAQSDQIRVSMPESPPPEPSSELANAVHQAKRGQRSATGVRNTTRGLAQATKKSRAVSTKDKSSLTTRRTVTGKIAPATGVQGDKAKIQKVRTSARTTSRKPTTIGKITQSNDNNVPAVPSLPVSEQMDIDETPADQDLALPELTQEAVAANTKAKAEAPSTTQPSLKVNKTRKKSSSPNKSKAGAIARTVADSEGPKTPPSRPTGNRQLTPQSAGYQETPRRRSPRLVEREERAKKVAEEARRRHDETPAVEMDIDLPETPMGNHARKATKRKI